MTAVGALFIKAVTPSEANTTENFFIMRLITFSLLDLLLSLGDFY